MSQKGFSSLQDLDLGTLTPSKGEKFEIENLLLLTDVISTRLNYYLPIVHIKNRR